MRLSCGSLALGRFPVLVAGVPFIVEDRVERGKIVWVWVEPSIEVLGPDVDDGPAVASGGHIGLGFVGDGSGSLSSSHARKLRLNSLPMSAGATCL